jgi:hypothetical protein
VFLSVNSRRRTNPLKKARELLRINQELVLQEYLKKEASGIVKKGENFYNGQAHE